MRRIRTTATLPLLLAMAWSPATGVADDLPAGVEQIIPRGAIPAIVDPQFVPASKARISDDAWVLGVVVEGQARAYSLNLLNHHEIVNDKVGNTSFAAVW